jgi:hypothetical protein
VHFVAALVGQYVLDTDQLALVICPFNRDLCLVSSLERGDFMIFSTVPGRVTLDFSGMACPFGVLICGKFLIEPSHFGDVEVCAITLCSKRQWTDTDVRRRMNDPEVT